MMSSYFSSHFNIRVSENPCTTKLLHTLSLSILQIDPIWLKTMTWLTVRQRHSPALFYAVYPWIEHSTPISSSIKQMINLFSWVWDQCISAAPTDPITESLFLTADFTMPLSKQNVDGFLSCSENSCCSIPMTGWTLYLNVISETLTPPCWTRQRL